VKAKTPFQRSKLQTPKQMELHKPTRNHEGFGLKSAGVQCDMQERIKPKVHEMDFSYVSAKEPGVDPRDVAFLERMRGGNAQQAEIPAVY
jgi:hypothetical protein